MKCCLDKMTTDCRDIDPQDHMIMKENVNIGRFLTMIYSATTFGNTFFYIFIMPNFTETIVDDRNVTLRSLPYPSDYYLFDVQFTSAFEIIYFIQSLVAYITCTIRSGTCSLAANFVTHACGQCEMIVTHINDLVDGYREELNTLDNRMRDIVQHHSRLIRFVADVEYIFNKYVSWTY
ncbi:uncharacterized protein LOC107264841 isoform X2 [Cephus cinctus]|uniref:Uncharacterized protein LOC107264841 isoform X2 n=1 Tax=Cephus cinctus TaxID=211228 RepID=A0AAJ7RBY5_CEPCN|nr:uncharacterized protein LOC107264841 isoform X2 [Cephus cinctus]